MPRIYLTALLAALALALALAQVSTTVAQPIPPRSGQRVITVNGEALTTFTYRPACRDPSLLIVVHGVGRNAAGYRDYARKLADKNCMVVVAPLFDSARFPQWRFSHGGLALQGSIQPAAKWSGHIFTSLIEAVRKAEGRGMEYSLFGHSGGAQMLMRYAASVPSEARRIVIANPGTLVWADLAAKAPYGLGELPAGTGDAEGLRRYLAQPISLYLGQDDTEVDENLAVGANAQKQGANRLERGLNIFKAAQAKARELNVPFRWRLVEVAGVGHTARRMLGHPEASAALAP